MSLSILSFQAEEGEGKGTVAVLEECPWVWGQSLTVDGFLSMHVPPGQDGQTESTVVWSIAGVSPVPGGDLGRW